MKYAICNEVYGDWSLERAFEHAKVAGYHGVEIAPFTLAKDVRLIESKQRDSVCKIAEQFELQVVGLHWLLAGTSGLHLTSPDSSVRQATTAYMRELVYLCRDLGGQVMVLGSPNERTLPPSVSVEDGKSFACEVLNGVADTLANTEVTLALEPLDPEETNFLNTARSAVELIERIDCEFIRLHLDVKAMSTEQLSAADLIEQHAMHLAHFHANDPNRRGPGSGDVDFEPIVRSLKRIGYDGWISVEVFDYSPGIDALVRESIDYLRRFE